MANQLRYLGRKIRGPVTVGDLRGLLKGLPSTMTLHCEVRGQDGSTWIMELEGEVVSESLVSLRLLHPELVSLPNITDTIPITPSHQVEPRIPVPEVLPDSGLQDTAIEMESLLQEAIQDLEDLQTHLDSK